MTDKKTPEQKTPEQRAGEHNRECLNMTIDPATKRYAKSNYDSHLDGRLSFIEHELPGVLERAREIHPSSSIYSIYEFLAALSSGEAFTHSIPELLAMAEKGEG